MIRQPKDILNKSEVLNHQTIQDSNYPRNANTKSRDRAGVHLPQVPMTPTEEQKRMAKNRNIEDRYKGANHDLIHGNNTINEMRA
jgi:hypothetical protein